MAEAKYNFSRLEKFLDDRFIYASDCLETLEKIESTLIHMEQVFVLHKDVSNAITFFEELKICIEEAIPNDRKRF